MRISDLFPLTEAIQSRPRTTPRIIRVSQRFEKEYAEFRDAFPDFRKLFVSFLRSKVLNDPPPQFGQKDTPFSSNNRKLVGYWHAHIIYGKALVIYDVDGIHLTLYRVTDHLAVEASRQSTLGNTLGTIQRDDSWDIMPLPAPDLPHDQAERATDLFQTMASHPADYRTLKSYAEGRGEAAMAEYLAIYDLTGVDADALRALAKGALGKRMTEAATLV